MIEGLQIPIPRRMIMVRWLVVISLVVCMLSTWTLWGGERNFPLATLEGLWTLPAPYDSIVMILVVVLLVFSLVASSSRAFMALALCILLWLLLQDLTRVQFWVYVYAAMILVFVFYDGRVDDSSKFTSYFIVLQIIVAAVYFFNGWAQLNETFNTSVFPELIAPLNHYVSDRQFALFVNLGKAVPYCMMFIGAGLVISPIRYLAIALAVVLHLALLILMFPSETHLNYALWLSNISFLLLVLLLFSGKTKQRYYSPTFLFQVPIFYPVFIAFVILPFSNSTGRWPDVLSLNFMAGAEKKVEIIIPSETLNELPLYERHFYLETSEGYQLDYVRWCREELNAEVLSEPLAFNSIYQYLQGFAPTGVKETQMKEIAKGGFLGKP